MAIKITDDCINCGNCEIRCPNKAIYERGQKWAFSYGSNNSSRFLLNNGSIVGSEDLQLPLSSEVYYIVTEKCTECVGFHNEPQCISVCPVDCCVPDDQHKESKEELQTKKKRILIE